MRNVSEKEFQNILSETCDTILDQMDWDDAMYIKAGGRERLEESLINYLEKQFDRVRTRLAPSNAVDFRDMAEKIIIENYGADIVRPGEVLLVKDSRLCKAFASALASVAMDAVMSEEAILDVLNSKKKASWEDVLEFDILRRQSQAIHAAQLRKAGLDIKKELCWSCEKREPMKGHGQCATCRDNQ